jgi:2'-5' RNA ligase
MAKDHFETHYYQKDRVDWNFNILMGNQPDVIRMADEYKTVLTEQEDWYDPILPQWLHMTMLRVGLTDDYSETEMQQVADVLAPKLAAITLPPEFIFDSWWQWGGVVLHISPENALKPVYDAIIEALKQVVGDDRTLSAPTGSILPHVALNYSKNHHNEVVLTEYLSEHSVKPARFTVSSLALIRQWPTDGHYEWEVVRDIPIGQL